MNIMAINSPAFSAGLKVSMLSKNVNRKLLHATSSNLQTLCGPDEIALAKAIVAINVAENAAIAASMAQMPGFDELALSANEIKMAMEIYNGVYDFKFSKTVVKSLIMGFLGNRVGSWLFKGASKAFTWIPGLGNGLNASVAGTTTAALGAAIIDSAEEMDKARRRGDSWEKILKEMQNKNNKR